MFNTWGVSYFTAAAFTSWKHNDSSNFPGTGSDRQHDTPHRWVTVLHWWLMHPKWHTHGFPGSPTAFRLEDPPQPSPPPFGESEMTFAWIKSERIKAGETFAMSAEGRSGRIRLWTWLECRCLHPPDGHAECVWACDVFAWRKTKENAPLGNDSHHIVMVNKLLSKSFICSTGGDNICG